MLLNLYLYISYVCNYPFKQMYWAAFSTIFGNAAASENFVDKIFAATCYF